MNELLDLILAPLDSGLADQVRQRFEAARHDPDTDDLQAWSEALRDYPDGYPPEWWLDPARCHFWLALQVDWKAYDEVEWQVLAIARTLGLETDFRSTAAVQWDGYFEYLKPLNGQKNLNGRKNLATHGTASATSVLATLRQALRNMTGGELLKPAQQPPSDSPTMDVLGEASEWLRAQGYELLYLSTGGDEYLAVPIRLDLLAQAQEVAADLNISTSLL